MTKRFGFTLAEVLITLGIIGVVAAMTMPTLMNSTQGAQYKAAYKKALSALSQAVTLNVALDEWNFSDMTGSGTYTMTKMLSDRMNVVRTEAGANGANVKLADGTAYKATASGETGVSNGLTSGALTIAEGNTTLFFNDGIMFTFPTAAASCTRTTSTGEQAGSFLRTDHPNCFGFVDVNGIKGPNKVVKCDTGKATASTGNDVCQISNPTDVYPVMFYDQSVLPATEPARAVLYAK